MVTGLEKEDWMEYAREATGLSREEVKSLDLEIRLEVSNELGHARIDITNAYLGK